MTRSLCQEVTKNWHSIPSNRTTACSGSNVSVDLGIVSLTLGNSQVLAGVWQLPGHGIAMNVRLKSKYNPSLASTAFLQTPVAIYYIWYVIRYMPEKAGQLWWGIPGSLAMLLLTFIVPILFMKDKNSKYPFDDRELYGYNKEHVMKLWEERKAAKAAKEAK